MEQNKILERLLDEAKPFIQEQERDLPKIRQAFDMCESYVSSEQVEQLLNQAEIAITMIGLGAKALMAIFLKPCLDNKVIDEKTISREFGDKVLGIVRGLQTVAKINTSRSRMQSENFIKLILSQADDVRVVPFYSSL